MIDNAFFFRLIPLIPRFGLNLMKTSRFTYEMTKNRAKISDKKKRRDKIMDSVKLRS